MIKKILIGVAAAIVLFLIVVAFQPGEFRVERSTSIHAPASVVFSQVNDFHKWEAWSPWAKMDPAAKNTFDGPASGKGAMFSWAGNDKVGEGSMTILDSTPDSLIRIKLEFIKPFPGISTTEYTFKQEGENTAVKWAMFGPKNFISKAFCMFMDMDKMVGGDFEKGLAQMKTVGEAEAAASGKEAKK
jgi:hypothetical protein